MKTVRAAVIGVGHMGRHHARILHSFADVSSVALLDPDPMQLEPFVSHTKADICTSLDELGDVDLAVIATPSDTHLEMAAALIECGAQALLVEKPLAPTTDEAKAIVSLCRDKNIFLSVGHVERFNPVVRYLTSLDLDPRLISFQRLSPYTPRISQSVVADLMVHDLDLACMFLGEVPPTHIEAVGTKVFSDTVDIASALLTWGEGTIVTMTASRATQDKVRTMDITEPGRFIASDFLRQDILIKRETSVDFREGGATLYRQENVSEIPYFDRSGEPLALELRNVVDSFVSGVNPLVGGAEGLRSVQLVEAVEAAISASL